METVQELVGVAEEKQAPEIKFKHTVAHSIPSRFGFAAQAMAFENARYFWMALMMTAQSCIGSIACMFILYGGGNVVALATCAAVTMGSNAMFIALAPPRVCLGVLYLSIVLNLAFIVANPM